MSVSIRRMWSCYSWNLKDRSLTVFDPILMGTPVTQIKLRHEKVVSELSKVIFGCLVSFFPSYTIKEKEWKIIYRNDISEKCKW